MPIAMVCHNNPTSDCFSDLRKALFAMTHLAEESHWFALSDGRKLYHTESIQGVVELASDYSDGGKKEGYVGIGYNSSKRGARPSIAYCNKYGDFAVASDSYFINGGELREKHGGDTDNDLIARYIADANDFERGIENLQNDIKGHFCAGAVTEKGDAFAARSDLGVRSLIYGNGERGYAILTESGGLESIGMERVRDINAAEFVDLNGSGLNTLKQNNGRMKLCSFNFPYYPFLDAVIEGIPVETVRDRIAIHSYEKDKASGLLERLEMEYGRENIIVVPIPDGGKPYAESYAGVSGLAYREPLPKYGYAGRSYDRPKQELRDLIAGIKLRKVPRRVAGKVVIVRDDSLRRGTQTIRSFGPIDLLKRAGAKEIHIGFCSPRNTLYCRLVPFEEDRYEDEMLAANRFPTDKSLADYLGVDSADFIELDPFVECIIRDSNLTRDDLCLGCYMKDPSYFDFLKK